MNISDFLKTIKKQKKISHKARLYIIDKNKYYFLNDGVLKNLKLTWKKHGKIY
jgi:hypothetical protein